MSVVKRNTAANLLGSVWTAAVSVLFVPIFIRYLGMEAYGLIGVFVTLEAIIVLLDMGVTPTMNREMARFSAGGHTPQLINDLLRSAEVFAVGVALLISAAMWAASGYLAGSWLQVDALPTETVARATGIMGLIFAVRFVEGIYRGALYGLQRQVWCNFATMSVSTARYAGSVAVLAWVSPTIDAFFAWHLVIAAASAVVFSAATHKFLPSPPSSPAVSREAISRTWRFAGGMMGITALGLVLTQADKVLLSRFLPLEIFGLYVLATTVVGVLRRITIPFTQAVYPRMVELVEADDHAVLTALYHQGAQLITVLTAPAALVLMLYGEGVVYAWSGDVELAANVAPIITPLALGVFLNGLMWMPYQLQLAHGWTRLTLTGNAIAVVILVPAIIWVAPRYGPVGTAWLWVLLNAGYVSIVVPTMHRRLLRRETSRWYVLDVLVPTLGALSVLLVATTLAPATYLDRWGWLGFLLLAGALSNLVAIGFAGRIRPYLLNPSSLAGGTG